MPNNNGFIIYPPSIPKAKLRDAKALAQAESCYSRNGFEARVENIDTQAVVARYAAGKLER